MKKRRLVCGVCSAFWINWCRVFAKRCGAAEPMCDYGRRRHSADYQADYYRKKRRK